MPISRDLKERAKKTREDGVFTLKLDEGVSLAMLVSFAQDMFPGVSTEDIGVWPADDRELVVSVRVVPGALAAGGGRTRAKAGHHQDAQGTC
jgi:hypothetical protein